MRISHRRRRRRTSLDGKGVSPDQRLEELLALDQALERLRRIDDRLRQIVEYRFFGGLTEQETAELIGVTPRTVQREWVKARAFLAESAGPLPAQTGPLPAPASEKSLSPSAHLRGFPTYLDSFVGREAELADLGRLLVLTRLLTLTGPGGAGKTRLSGAVARAAAPDFEDGACFVDLVGISDPSAAAPAIARALDLPDVAGIPVLANLKKYLASKNLLLVIDNFEHVLEATAVVRELLDSCPDIKIIATSRAPLRLIGEKEFPVPPLQVPRDAVPMNAEIAERHSALRLFVERARAARPEFSLSDSNAGDVSELCRRLDGLPLAIELAAARVKLFAPSDLVSRLAGRLDLLCGGTQDQPERHRALRETIAWSYDLLDEPARRFFRRMAVFSRGWTLEAAEGVCADDAELRDGVLDWLAALAEQSLLVRSEDAESGVRFLMLETIRAFALDCLQAADEEEHLRRAHAEYFLSLAEKAAPELTGADQWCWLNLLEADQDNLRAALRWTEESREDILGIGLASSLWRFWIARGHINEGLQVFERLLSRPTADGNPKETHSSTARAGNSLPLPRRSPQVERNSQTVRYVSPG